MTNEMKLLRIFIEASGYEVEEDKYIIMADGFRYEGHDTTGINPNLIVENHVDYKVTKKQTETEYLLSSEANAKRLEESIGQFKAGEVI